METTILGFKGLGFRPPKVCKIMAFMAVMMGLGLFVCILLGVWVMLNSA